MYLHRILCFAPNFSNCEFVRKGFCYRLMDVFRFATSVNFENLYKKGQPLKPLFPNHLIDASSFQRHFVLWGKNKNLQIEFLFPSEIQLVFSQKFNQRQSYLHDRKHLLLKYTTTTWNIKCSLYLIHYGLAWMNW